MSLVITGASGNLGRRTAELLLDAHGVDAADLVLITRDPAKLADLAARGASVRSGDFDDPASLTSAFAGATSVLVVSTDGLGKRVAQHGAAFSAARDAGATFIAYTSLPNPSEDNPAGVAGEHRGSEAALRESGAGWAVLRNAMYAEYQLPEAQQALASGEFHYNSGDGATAYVSREDCAAAAAAVLAGGAAAHAGKVYDITGPELLSGTDRAALYTELRGEPVAGVAVEDAAFTEGLVAAGLPAEAAALIASFGAAIRVGALDQLSDDVATLTGNAPRSLRAVLEGALATA